MKAPCGRSAPLLLTVAMIAITISCSSTLVLDPVVHTYRDADYAAAYGQLQEMEDEYLEKQGPLLFSLDAGMVSHHAGLYDLSNRYLDRAERLIGELYTESVRANVASYLVNDNTRAYQGEDYEDLYAHVFKALNYVHKGEGESALVELRRFAEKQQFLQNKYDTLLASVEQAGRQSADLQLNRPVSLRFSSSALGNWLHMVIARDLEEADQAQFSQAQVRQAFDKQASLYPFKVPSSLDDDLGTGRAGTYRVNVVAFTGLAPYKEEEVERFWLSPHNYVKIALPVMIARPTRVHSAQVRLNDGRSFILEPIEDIGAIAQEAFRLNRSFIESKTVLRSVLKSTGTMFIDAATSTMAAGAESREEANNIEFFGSLLSFASRIFNEASEQADVRSSHFFPDRAWIGGVDLPAGIYDARVVYRDRYGKQIGEQELSGLRVGPNRIHLWESVYPW